MELHRPAHTMSIQEVALCLGVGRSTIYDAIRASTFPLPVISIGARKVVPRAAVLRLLEIAELPSDLCTEVPSPEADRHVD